MEDRAVLTCHPTLFVTHEEDIRQSKVLLVVHWFPDRFEFRLRAFFCGNARFGRCHLWVGLLRPGHPSKAEKDRKHHARSLHGIASKIKNVLSGRTVAELRLDRIIGRDFQPGGTRGDDVEPLRESSLLDRAPSALPFPISPESLFVLESGSYRTPIPPARDVVKRFHLERRMFSRCSR
jgi:hypothetical protein